MSEALWQSPQATKRPGFETRRWSLGALRLAPWLIFGPITGVMSEAAINCFKNGRPVLGSLWILLNVGILVAIPAVTAVLGAHLS